MVALMTAGLAVGATVPPFGALCAARWPALLRGRAETFPAFAFETISHEIAFPFGPGLVAVTAARLRPAAGTVAAGALVVGAGLVFVALRRTDPASAATAAPDRTAARGSGTPLPRNSAVLLTVSPAPGVFFGSNRSQRWNSSGPAGPRGPAECLTASATGSVRSSNCQDRSFLTVCCKRV